MVQLWEIVGGKEKGGILVRSGPATSSAALEARLTTGSLVEELKLQGDRLNYKLIEGSGPPQGWVAIKLANKELAKRIDGTPKVVASSNGVEKEKGPESDGTVAVALLFPGQGSQYVKMLAEAAKLPQVRDMLDKAKDILGYDILQICLEGPEEKLEETRFCQPAMFLGGLAAVEKLRQESASTIENCKAVAGLSLGEYTGLCVAGVFSFEDGLKLVKLRGEAMQEAAADGEQLMVSVVGIERANLESECQNVLKLLGGNAVCQIANVLFPKGFAVGGTKVAVETLKEAAEKAGALQAKILKTSGAFHTPLMQPAQDKLSAALDEMLPRMAPPKYTVWMNASAEPLRPGSNPEEIVALLKKQLTNPVLWEPSMRAMLHDGVSEFYECGPMKQIKAMMKRIDMNAWKKTQNIEV